MYCIFNIYISEYNLDITTIQQLPHSNDYYTLGTILFSILLNIWLLTLKLLVLHTSTSQ